MNKAHYVYIAATFDTKRDEAHYIADLISATGLNVRLVDLATLAHADTSADVSADTIASYHPNGMDAVFTTPHNDAISAMSLAFERYIASRNDVAALLGLGGSCGTTIILPAMQSLRVGIPKLMISTMLTTDTLAYIGCHDICLLYPITDIAGLNPISYQVLANAAHSIAGAVQYQTPYITNQNPSIGFTMFGVTTPCITYLTQRLSNDFNCLVFHATGNGGMSMERLVNNGLLNAVFDFTTTEITDLLFGGVLSCKSTRLDSIISSQIPYFGSCGALDIINFGAAETIPPHYQNRLFHQHNSQVTLMRTTPEENYQIGEWIGKKLNACQGEVRFYLPEGGFSALDIVGQPFWYPESNQALFSALKKTIKQTEKRQLISLPYHINQPLFAEAILTEFKQVWRKHSQSKKQAINNDE